MEDLEPHKTPYQIALVFFGKVSAWILIPAVVLVVAHIFTKNLSWHTYAIVIATAVTVGISFYGIYKESTALIEHHDI